MGEVKDVGELAAALARAKVHPNYRINGRLAGRFPEDGMPYIEKAPDGRWVIGVSERGSDRPHQYFMIEQEACRHFYDWLTKPGKMPEELTADEIASIEAARRRRATSRSAEL